MIKKMRKKTRVGILFLVVISLITIIAACSDHSDGDTNTNINDHKVENNKINNDEKNNNEDVDPVTIKLAIPLGEEFFEGRFGAVDEKLEHINLEHIFYGNSLETLEELFTNNVYPDIFVADIPALQETEIIHPLDDLIEKHGFDLDRIDPSLTSYIRSLDKDGNMVGLPDGRTFWALYYDKNVFDTLGKDYPDPDVPMTWSELIDLARELTTEVGGTQYYGLTGTIGAALSEFAVNSTDPETGEVLIEKDPAFKRFFDMLDSYYSIPGMDTLEGNPIVEEQTVAMHIESNNWLDRGWGWPEPEEVEHLDLAPMPVWEDQPDITPAQPTWPMVIANYSEYKDEAFEVLTTYLDNDIQIEMAKTMMLQTPLVDPDVLKYYGSEVPTYQGKNIDAHFVGQSAVYETQQSKWDDYVDINGAMDRLKEERTDVVTLLRELAEESEAKIKEAMEMQ